MFARAYALMIYVTDMDAAVAFYTETLGFTRVVEDSHWSELSLGGWNLALHLADGPHSRDAFTPKPILEVADIQAQIDQLEAAGVPVLEPIRDIGGNCGWCATVLDPSGNPVSFFQNPRGPHPRQD